jgi:transketolase
MKTPYPLVPPIVIDTVRVLSIDAVQKANSGHPGTPMGAAEMTLVLWSHFLRFNPKQPDWRDRDRFILSVGHASMLLYSLLHIFGYDCTLDDIQGFRKIGSRTAGHPEVHHLAGVEMTTGPLGQGVSSAVGFALGQELLAGKFNQKDGQFPVKGRVWALAGDGCMMEGVSSEAASLAGHLGLGNLSVIYDQNKVSIDGATEISFTEDVGARYEAYGWQVLKVDAYDQAALCEAFEKAEASERRPTLIVAQSIIGRGAATLEGSAATHGQALGPAELEATKKKMGWTLEPFQVPEETYAWCKDRVAAKTKAYDQWQQELAAWKGKDPIAHAAWDAQFAQKAPAGLAAKLAAGMATEKAASRKHGYKVLNRAAAELPWLIGGSADLTESNGVGIKDSGAVKRGPKGVFEGRNIYFGVREHAMGAIANGLALHGAWRPYTATFLQFADYMRPSVRLAALMKARSIFVFTHDSIFLGEDGPTHQAVEHISALRLIPGLDVWRPADGLETAYAWDYAAEHAQGPVALCLSRQNLPLLAYPANFNEASILKGGYVLAEDAAAELTVIATGSEVGTAAEAIAQLAKGGVKARLVSLPCADVFKAQDKAYQDAVLGNKPRVVLEAGSTAWWPHLVGSEALVLGVDEFGLSGPGEDVAKHFNLSAPQVAERILAWNSQRVKTRG